MESLLLSLTNEARSAAGIAPLQFDATLQRVAQEHAQAMANAGFFDHVDQRGGAIGERLLQSGYNYRWAGENISAGKDSVGAVFDWWMTSDGHRANILQPDFQMMGMGYAYVAVDRLAFNHYWVQVFAAPL